MTLGWETPARMALERTAALISRDGTAASSCEIFVIGLFLVGCSFTAGISEGAWLVTITLLVHPAITWRLAFAFMDIDPVWVVTVISRLPYPRVRWFS